MPELLKSRSNLFRFMPGRVSPDGKVLFEGHRYVRGAVDRVQTPTVGLALGPTQGQFNDVVMMSDGGIIIPTQPGADFKTVEVTKIHHVDSRDKNPDLKKRRMIDKSIVRLATFQQLGDHLVAAPYRDEDEVYFEIWTGDFGARPKEGTFQLIQANMFSCGAVAYVGGGAIVTAKSKSRAKKSATDNPNDDNAPTSHRETELSGKAELVKERQGDIVGGVPLWVARTFRVRFSAKQSESILVKQLGDYWLCTVEDGLPTIEPVPAAAYAKSFERLFIEQPIKAVSEKTAVAA